MHARGDVVVTTPTPPHTPAAQHFLLITFNTQATKNTPAQRLPHMVDSKTIEQKWQERWTEAAAKFKAAAPVIHKALEAQIH